MIHRIEKGEIPLLTELTSLPGWEGDFVSLEKAVRAELEVIQKEQEYHCLCVEIQDWPNINVFVRYHFCKGEEVGRFFKWTGYNDRRRKKFWRAILPESCD